MFNFGDLAQQILTKNIPRPSSGNQRAYADVIEELGCDLAKRQWPSLYRAARSVRSPEDFTLVTNTSRVLVDIKTRQLNTEFNMPNLISVDRLQKLLDDSAMELWYWIIDYEVDQSGSAAVVHSELVPVWNLNWQCLSIGNLGLGQLQITNWNNLVQSTQTKAVWANQLRETRKEFYTNQATKFQKLAESI